MAQSEALKDQCVHSLRLLAVAMDEKSDMLSQSGDGLSSVDHAWIEAVASGGDAPTKKEQLLLNKLQSAIQECVSRVRYEAMIGFAKRLRERGRLSLGADGDKTAQTALIVALSLIGASKFSSEWSRDSSGRNSVVDDEAVEVAESLDAEEEEPEIDLVDQVEHLDQPK